MICRTYLMVGGTFCYYLLVDVSAKTQCIVLLWRVKYTMNTFFLVATALMLMYYRVIALRGSSNVKNLVWIIALIQYVLITVFIFVLNIRKGAFARNDTHKAQFQNFIGGLPFQLSTQIPTSLKFFARNIFSLSPVNDLVLKAFAIHWCTNKQ